jgi:2-polyprenyl-3-methyl-5-hydroxy-6-metoxy-1,4-benzoquinol methylase
MKKINKTWNEFWGKFLLIDFHKDNQNKWELMQKKADWILDNGVLITNSKLLDLGCGSGILDICIAKMGIDVTAIDRIQSVLKITSQEANGASVHFIHDDIRSVSYSDCSFDCIIVLETLGLMDKEDDQKLLEKSFSWLNKNGKIIVDCPDPSSTTSSSWTRKLNQGTLQFESSFDKQTSIQTITPKLTQNNNEEIQLYDPYSSEKGNYYGVKRYLYSKDELKNILSEIGFIVNNTEHYWGDKFYAMIGTKN